MGIVNSVYQMFWTPQKPIEDKEEIQGLKNKLRKQKSSTDAATADQVAQLEREITDEWTEKSEKMIKAAEDKHKRTLREMEEEKVQAQQNAKDLEKKVQALKSSGNESDNQISGLQGRVEELEAWKDKYDKLRSQAGVMKEKYEERIEELEEEVENAKKATTTKPGPAGDSASDVKKIMSSVYHSLRGQLDTSETFTGSQALTIILNTIKSETLKMTSDAKDEESEEVSDDEEEESEDEAEEKPVVMETLSAQTASPTQGAKASKASKSDSPAKKKEDRTMTSIEDDILSQLVGSGMTVTDKKSTSPKKENEIVKSDETLVKASSAYITGDKGNKYYSEELDKSKGNEVIKEVIEPAIKSSNDAITGDKGNKYYTEELDKGKHPAADITKKQDTDKKSNENKSDDKKVEETIDAGFSSAEIEAMLFGASTSPSKSQPKIELKKEKPVAVEPLLASSTAGTSMGGNPYYGKNLDQSGREEVKADVIEPMMASSTASSNLGAKPKNSPKKKAVVEPLFEKSSDKITGDKGNKYYSEELDKNRVAAVEGMIIKSSGHPTGGDRGNIHYSKHLDQSAASKDKSKVVEEPLLASSNGGLTASAPKGDKSAHKPVPIEEPLFAATATSVTSAQPVIVPKLKKSVDHPTGDKGNKYHSEKLDKTDKKAAKPIVEPALVRSHDHPTGDKGNPHHAAKLNKSDKGGDSIKPEKSKGVNSVPPGGKPIIEEAIVSKANSGQTSAAPKGKKGKAVVEEAMVAKATSGQTMAAPSANKTPDKQSDKKAVIEPMVSKKTDHVTGDRGNPHHSAKLDQSVSSKPKPAPIVQPLFGKSSSKPTGDKGNPYHSTKLDKTKGKDKSGAIPPVSSRDPPPLDDNKTDSLLFGDDNTVQDTFGTDFKPRAESVEKGDKKDAKKDDKKSSDKKTPSKVDLLADDSLKGKPPPLFGDEEEEDDLDWLS